MSAVPEVIAAAVQYMDRGFAIVAAKPNKAPFDKNWRRQFSKQEILDRLHGRLCNSIGFLGGDLNNHIVPLDFDTKAGEAWWRNKCESAGIDPDDFPIVITPGKVRDGKRTPGLHRYVRDVRGTLGNSQGELKALGIDVRGKGHAMLPPSPHPDGGVYRWLERRRLGDFEVIPSCPDFLYAAIGAHHAERTNGTAHAAAGERERRYAQAALDGACSDVGKAHAGVRNETLNIAAFRLGTMVGAGWIGRKQVEAALLAAAYACGLVRDDGEAAGKKTIASGLNAGITEPHKPLEDRPHPNGHAHETPHREEKAEANDTAEPLSALGEWGAGEDDDHVPPRGWLLGNIFCRRFISSLLADGGVGKTALRLAQLISLAIGRSLTGEHVFQRCRVLVVCLEDDANELRRRIRAVRLHHNVAKSELKGWLFVSAPGARGGKLMIDQNGKIERSVLADKIEAAILARTIDIAMLDPFVKTHSVEENANSAIDDVVQILSDMAAKYDIAIDVPHHVSKGAADPGNANRGRGASAANDAMRLVYTLSVMTPDEAKTMGIPDGLRRSLIRMDSAKVNIAPPMHEAKWFRLVGVPLGNATDRYPQGDEVQTVEPWSPPDAWAGVNNFLANQILDDIDRGMEDGERSSDAPNANVRAAWRVVVRHMPNKEPGPAREIIKGWVKSGALVHEEYDSKARGEPVTGLKVDPAKRPS